MNIFEQDIVTFFGLLNKHEVRYLLVGGLAVNFHGYSRTTGDIDVWLADDQKNREQLVKSLLEYGVEGAETFLDYPLTAGFAEIMLDNGMYIDLMADLQFIKQSEFNACYDLCTSHKLENTTEIKIIHINKLVEEKEKSTRPKDIDDAIHLKKLHNI